jgi:serine phosphatase RsbU (regulator of sigma subunit)
MKTGEQTATIALVDDEELILSSLGAMFRLETDYQILAFSNPVQALQELERIKVDLVISDYLMPQMTGIDLLQRVKQVQPEAVRILLTGFADKENAIRAVNTVGLYQYLEKPWDTEALLLAVRNALKEKGLRRQLAERIHAFDKLFLEHRQLAERHTFLEQELEMAARVQQSLFPIDFPAIEGFRFHSFYQPCRAIGGDYYDFSLGAERAVLLVSDVSGHGIQAALASMLLKAIFHETAVRAQGPAELLEHMNMRLHRFLPEGMFAAALVAWLDLTIGRLQLGSAGLPCPFVLRSSECRLDEIPLGGFPLGIFGTCDPACFDVKEVRLVPGDVLLIASDGLSDICGKNDECFQDRTLKMALTELLGKDGSQVIEGLVERARAFSEGRQQQDDVSLIAITRVEAKKACNDDSSLSEPELGDD